MLDRQSVDKQYLGDPEGSGMGEMGITITDGKHFYEFEHTFDSKPV